MTPPPEEEGSAVETTSERERPIIRKFPVLWWCFITSRSLDEKSDIITEI